MRGLLLGDSDPDDPDCRCEPTAEGNRLIVDANTCSGDGALADSPACRATVVDALADREAEAVLVRDGGRERAYLDDSAALLGAAGRFAARAEFRDARLAALARSEPIRAAREARGRAGPLSDVAAETGLALGADRFADVESALRPYVGLTTSEFRVALDPPRTGRLRDRRSVSTDATVRRYERDGDALDVYHLEPVEAGFDDDALATLDAARDRIADGTVTGERAAHRAVRHVLRDRGREPSDAPVERLGAVLRKHTSGTGLLADLFADPDVSDVFVNAPVRATPLRVRVGDDLLETNVRLGPAGARALASQFRLESGRAFSRARPTLDATTTIADRRVRVAGTTDPVSEGLSFTFRAHDRQTWRLPDLVENGTASPKAAALLSVATRRGAAALIAGTRGAGKSTLLAALLWELPPDERTLVIEDAPELPVDALREAGRDVQSLRTSTDDGPGLAPAETLRTALRLGECALVVGEVRGEEAAVLYEAMRVGDSGGAVLGTIHGNRGEGVRERVVADLDVPESSFASTDLIVTLGAPDESERGRHVAAVEEVVRDETGVRFEALFEPDGDRLAPTGRVDRGNSRLVADLASPTERYADVRAAVEGRERELASQTASDSIDGRRSTREP